MIFLKVLSAFCLTAISIVSVQGATLAPGSTYMDSGGIYHETGNNPMQIIDVKSTSTYGVVEFWISGSLEHCWGISRDIRQ